MANHELLAAAASGTSYLWTSVPYPLRWIPSGLYQLELRPSSPTGEDTSLLAKSPFFTISESGTVGDSSGEDPPVGLSASLLSVFFETLSRRKMHRG